MISADNVDITLGPNPDDSVALWLLKILYSQYVYACVYIYMHKYDYMYPCIIMCNYIYIWYSIDIYIYYWYYSTVHHPKDTLLILQYSIRTFVSKHPNTIRHLPVVTWTAAPPHGTGVARSAGATPWPRWKHPGVRLPEASGVQKRSETTSLLSEDGDRVGKFDVFRYV